jgi:hypothetical protein
MLDEQLPQATGLMGPAMTNVNGILPVRNNAMLEADRRKIADRTNNEPIMRSLASHVRSVWVNHYHAKQDVEQRMLQSLRQRRGEYDPNILSEIRKQGGSEVYMMLTSNKCRAAKAWLVDTLLGTRDQKPWTITPTRMPDLSPSDMDQVKEKAVQAALELEQMYGPMIDMAKMEEIVAMVKDRTLAEAVEIANKKIGRMEDKMEDQMQEGNFLSAFVQFLDDITTFPAAVMKGPVIRNKPKLTWVPGPNNTYNAEVKKTLVKEWERVDPFMLYPSPNAADINDGDLIERHRMSRGQLEELKGVDGYSDDAINAVLEQYGVGGLREWLSIDSEKATAEGRNTLTSQINSEGLIDALQFWGSVSGRKLIEWGMTEKEIPDENKEYNCEVWLIGSWVIKATLNYDPFGRKPYYKTCYEEIPGVFWGNSVADLIRDCQAVCNSAARSLVNNMGISSGPQVDVNVDRLPAGEDLTEMHPWKIWQTTSDPYGSTAPAINFFQPSINSAELMGIYERFSVLADEYSSIPRYMTGDASAGGAGRTASGMSMLMGNAGKGIKNVISNIDQRVIEPAIERLYYHNMQYEEDPDLKGDIRVVAMGANALVVKEQAQVRRNEFLQIVLNSPVVSQLVGMEGLAMLLREGMKTLDMDTDKIIPSPEVLRARAIQQQLMASQQMQMMPQQQGQVIGQNGQTLENGAPVTDNFSPNRT